MEALEEFLSDISNNLPILQKLRDNDIIDMDTFGEIIINDSDFKELIPSIGLRTKLRKKYQCLKDGKWPNTQADESILGVVNADGSVSIESMNVSQNTDIIEIVEHKSKIVLDTDVTNNTKEKKEPADILILEESVAKKIKLKQPLNFDLEEVLKNDVVGRAILNIYNNTRDLSTQCQGYLCDIIVTYCLNKNITTLRNEDFDLIADNIIHIFPEECKETYYVPPVFKKDSSSLKSKVSKGKLVDKYRNKQAFLRRANIKTTSDVSHETSVYVPLEAEENSKKWLIHNRLPWADVIKHWNCTYTLRQTNCKDKLYDLFEQWPILLSETGYLLIEQDFCHQYKEKDQALICKWNDFFNATLSLNGKSLHSSDEILVELLKNGNLTQNSQDFIQISLLASLVTPRSNKLCVKKQGKKSYWKPSIIESREGIVLHVKVPGDIQKAIHQKTEKLFQYGLTVQPFIVVVGAEATNIDKVYLCVDQHLTEIPSMLKALDVAFKIFISYNVRYPKESEHLWYLLQWGIYEIHTNFDEKIPSIFNFINKLKKR